MASTAIPADGYNETDTRAKLIDPALYAAQWVERVDDAQRAGHGEIHREQSAVRIDSLDGKPFKCGRGRVDYLLRAYLPGHAHPLTLAFVEAKRSTAPPTEGLEQVKAYARRHAVKFVYATNGHLFIEYDAHTGLTSTPPADGAVSAAGGAAPALVCRHWPVAGRPRSGGLADAVQRGRPPSALLPGRRRARRAGAGGAGRRRPGSATRLAVVGHRRRQDQHRRGPAAAPDG